MASINPGPQKPARISVQRERLQRKGRVTGNSYTSLDSAKAGFSTAVSAQNSDKTIDRRPSLKRNGGTQQYAKRTGRQKPL